MNKDWKILPNLYNALISHKYPVYLIHFVTERCNARCPHCFVDFKTADNELNLEQIKKISSTSGNCLRNVALTGGEPFLRNDLFEIADIWYKNSKTQTISITTNGSMPDRIEAFAKQAVQKNIPVTFIFSYDFIGEKHSEYRRLKNLHINVLESYKIIKSFGTKLNAAFTLTVSPESYSTAEQTYVYMRDTLKISNIAFALIRGENANSLSPEERNKISEVYERLELQRDKDYADKKITGYQDKSLTSVLLNAKNRMLWKYVLKTFKEQKYISPCSAGSLFGVIYSKGNVAPCEVLNTKIADLNDFDYNFMELWSSMQAEKIRKNIKNTKCFCTFECSKLIDIFSSPRYFGELAYNILRNGIR